MQAILALEDGRIFRGESYGAKRECFGEVVFNTALTGYQEIFHRSFLRWTDRCPHQSANRKLRHQRRRQRSQPPVH